jgi:hypothetical protein
MPYVWFPGRGGPDDAPPAPPDMPPCPSHLLLEYLAEHRGRWCRVEHFRRYVRGRLPRRHAYQRLAHYLKKPNCRGVANKFDKAVKIVVCDLFRTNMARLIFKFTTTGRRLRTHFREVPTKLPRLAAAHLLFDFLSETDRCAHFVAGETKLWYSVSDFKSYCMARGYTRPAHLLDCRRRSLLFRSTTGKGKTHFRAKV